MQTSQNTDFDLIVVGGGPGGTACATFVAMQGHRVLLLEKNVGPSFRIGESLLPATIHGICPLLGVSDALKKANFVSKTGGRFVWGHNKKPWDFLFGSSEQYAGPTSAAYQVERMEFDQILRDNARDKGVDIREGHTAEELLISNDHAAGVRYIDPNGVSQSSTSRYVVDASGLQGCLARFAGRRLYSKFFQNVAIFRYYKGSERLPEPLAGNVFTVAFQHGWFWHIPLRNDLVSVGVVFGKEQAQGIKESGYDEVFEKFLHQCPEVEALLANAERVTEGLYGITRICQDFSYTSNAFYKNGLVLVGDTACFIDPLFSSGVHLSTYSALLAARSINTRLRGELSDAECFAEYEARYRREYLRFYDFLVAFYDAHQQDNSDFWRARKVANSPEKMNREYIDLIARPELGADGDSKNIDAFWKNRSDLSSRLFPEATNQSTSEVDSQRQRSRFLASLFRELTQLQLQAILQEKRPSEKPIRTNGLIPSRDGFHWTLSNVSDQSAAAQSSDIEVVV
jgi:FAD-dependent halogenase